MVSKQESKNQENSTDGGNDRLLWLNMLTSIAAPVLENLSRGELNKNMPLEYCEDAFPDRDKVSHLEAFGRLVAGMAPWLGLDSADNTGNTSIAEEDDLRRQYLELYREAVAHAVAPDSPDFLNFTGDGQPLVDTAFLAHALIRAPDQLFHSLNSKTRDQLIAALKSSRRIKPHMCNWLLFSAMVETALFLLTGSCEMEPISFALEKHAEWYVGDGTYGDGPEYHWDYYNSFVIQPMMLDITKTMAGEKNLPLKYSTVLPRAQRYCEVMERLISPEGSYPPLGRSLPYRFGAFQLPAQLALTHDLPGNISPGQMRSALTAVIKRFAQSPDLFDKDGWLRVGFISPDVELAEPYLSTGSMYLCSAGLLTLGLPATDPFWAAPAEDWTAKKLWNGGATRPDHAFTE